MSKIIIRRKNDLFCSQRDKYKLQLDRALHKIEYLRSNAQMAESQCRELDSALTNARRECSELRAVEAKYSVTACNLVPIIFKLFELFCLGFEKNYLRELAVCNCASR